MSHQLLQLYLYRTSKKLSVIKNKKSQNIHNQTISL